MIRRFPNFALASVFAIVLLSGCGRDETPAVPTTAGPEAGLPGVPAAPVILQDVIDDFVPQIEAELKRRLDARLERLLNQRKV